VDDNALRFVDVLRGSVRDLLSRPSAAGVWSLS
jgi:hypothetical protein